MSKQAARTGPVGADFSDRRDFVNADHGFVGALEPMVITAADGRVVWDMDSWASWTVNARARSIRASGGKPS